MKILTLFLILLAAVPPASAQVTDEALQCFRWFATLGYPDVEKARWSEIWSGRYSSSDPKEPPKVYTSEGFVTNETDTEFVLVRTDLSQGTLKKSKPDAPAHLRVAFEERPFLKMIGQRLDLLKNPPKDGFRGFGTTLGYKAEVFFLAYVCWQRGENHLAAQLYEEAQKLPHTYVGERKAGSMQESLEIDLGHAAMWDAVLRCGGGVLGWDSWGSSGKLESRPVLLEAFRRVVRLFPRCAHVERAKQCVTMLERLIGEDKTHIPLSREQIDQLPQDQRIAELVWLLRDQNGHQWGQPGWCDVFSMDTVGTSPAHQLLAIGDSAAPALIQALTDDRFSRSVGFHRDFHFSHTILTVGDCAQQILSRMTGQDFYRPGSTSGYMSNEEKMRDVQKAAQQWWKDYQQKGKKQMLVDSITAGKTSPGQLVQQLQKVAPDTVEDALLRGADNAESDWLARQFVASLAALKTPQATQRIVKFMKDHPQLEVRLDAAGRLLNQEHAEALPAILHEWDVFSTATDRHDVMDAFEDMVELLAASGDEQAMRKLVERWDGRVVHERFEIVQKLGEWLGNPAKEHHFTEVKGRPASAKAAETAVELLVHALEDEEASDGISGGIGDFVYSSPRICDFALWALHEIDGKKYVFSPKAGRRQRDAERITAANLWRKEHQKPLLPPPPPPGERLAEKDALKIVLVRVEPQQGLADEALVKRALGLRGSQFGPKTISSLLLDFAKQPMSGAHGLRVEAFRGDDLTGVELHLRFKVGAQAGNNDHSWVTMHHGQIGANRLGSSGGSSSLSYLREDGYWDDFEEEITDGFQSASPTSAFTLCAGLRSSP